MSQTSKTQYNLATLEPFINEVLNIKFNFKEDEKTFFDIAGFPHYENVVSNLYAYFLNPENDHNLGRLFLDSLIELTDKNLIFENVNIEREKQTNKGRIDILITDVKDKSEKAENAIVIENKIYAYEYNDFNDYLESTQANNITGIILSPYQSHIKQNEAGFLYISHYDFINQIKANLGQYINDIPEKHLFILKEFIKSLEKLNISASMKENIEFYFKHHKKIDELVELKNEVNQYLIDQCYQLMPLNDWQWCRVSSRGYSIKYKDKGLYIYFATDELFSEQRFHVGYWIYYPDIKKQLKSLIDIGELSKKFKSLKTITDYDGSNWLNFAYQDYLFSTVDEIKDFKNFLLKNLQGDWKVIAEYIDSNLPNA
jgi:hypothetical protein